MGLLIAQNESFWGNLRYKHMWVLIHCIFQCFEKISDLFLLFICRKEGVYTFSQHWACINETQLAIAYFFLAQCYFGETKNSSVQEQKEWEYWLRAALSTKWKQMRIATQKLYSKLYESSGASYLVNCSRARLSGAMQSCTFNVFLCIFQVHYRNVLISLFQHMERLHHNFSSDLRLLRL